MNAVKEGHQAILDKIAGDWSPRQIRDLASTLMRLADSLDQEWDGSNVKSIFGWPEAGRAIERNAVNLAYTAKLIYAKRQVRRKYISGDLLAEPAWDMLLELFMQFAGGAKVSITSLAHASHVPMTTALRYIDMLENEGLVERTRSNVDKRVTLLNLSKSGIVAVGTVLEQY